MFGFVLLPALHPEVTGTEVDLLEVFTHLVFIGDHGIMAQALEDVKGFLASFHIFTKIHFWIWEIS